MHICLSWWGELHTREPVCTQQQWPGPLPLNATHCGKPFTDGVTPLFPSGWETRGKDNDCGWKFHFTRPTQPCGLSLHLLSFNSLELLVGVGAASSDGEMCSSLGKDVFHVATNPEHSSNARCSLPLPACSWCPEQTLQRPLAGFSGLQRGYPEMGELEEKKKSQIWLSLKVLHLIEIPRHRHCVNCVGCQPGKIPIVCKLLCALKPQSHYFHVTWTYNFCQGRLN